MKDIKLWFAYDENEEVIEIENATKGKLYHCPCCGAEVYAKALNSKEVSMHFCHANGKSCSTNSGESYVHKWAKNVLFTVGQSFKVNTKDGIKEYTVEKIDIEKRYDTANGEYVPDITITTTNNERIFVEIYNTSKKSIKKYYLKWFALKSMVIEIDIKRINKSEILTPIYEDTDRFFHFKDEDYKDISDKQNIDEDTKERIRILYNDIYDYVVKDGSIENILKYKPYYLSKYICKSIEDNIRKDINDYNFLKWANDVYKLDYEVTNKIKNFNYNNNRGTTYDIKLTCEKCGKQFSVNQAYSIWGTYIKEQLSRNMCIGCLEDENILEIKSYFGEIGEKIDIIAKIEHIKWYYNKWGGKYIYTFSCDGNEATWDTSVYLTIEEGDMVRLKGTIKEYYEGKFPECVLTRCKVEKL